MAEAGAQRVPRDLIIVALALFTWGIGEGLFFYFQPLYLQEWGANPVEIGAILSMVGVAMVVSQVPAGYLSDRIGALPVMQAAYVIGLAAAVLMALAGTLPVFLAGMMLYGTTSFVVPPMNSYITRARGSWSVERAFTVTGAAFQLGMVAGPLIGGWIGEQVGLRSVYRLSAAVFLLSTVIIYLARRPAPLEQAELPGPRRGLASNPRFLGLLVMIFFTMFALYLPQPLTPIFLREHHGFSVQQVGMLGATGSLGNAVIMLSLGHLRAPTGMLVGQAMVWLFALILWRGAHPLMFFGAYFLAGGFRLFRSMALAYTRSTVRAGETGLAFGLVETASALSLILAPLAAGYLYQRGPHLIYLASLVAIAAMLAFYAWRLRAGKLAAQPEEPPARSRTTQAD